jgi:hypothetical protein
LRVDSPKLAGPVQLWIDPAHGFLPRRVETFRRMISKSPTQAADHARTIARQTIQPRAIIQVDEFIEIAKEVWVPTKGTFTRVMNGADGKMMNMGSESIVVDVSRSSWNTIRSGELFAPASLPTVNHQENGWQQYYGAERLARVRHIDEMTEKMRQEAQQALEPSKLLLVLVGINIVVILSLAGLILRRRIVHRRSMHI